MFDDFLKRKINSLLESFTEDSSGDVHINKWEGVIERHDIKLNNRLTDLLARLLGMPLQLIGGRVSKLSVQIPWSTLLKDETKAVLDGVFILCRTTADFNLEFFQKNRRRAIDKVIRMHFESNNDIQSRKNKYLSKLKDFFFSRISLQVKNVHICLENNIEKTFSFGLVIDKGTIKNIFKEQQHRLIVSASGVGLYLNNLDAPTANFKDFLLKTKQLQYLIKPTNITYERTEMKTKLEVQNSLSFDPIIIKLNNMTLNLLRLLLSLRQFHSNDSKTSIYKLKFTMNNKSAQQWWRFLTNVLRNQLKSERYRRKFRYLPQRRKYIDHYKMIFKGRHFINQLGPNNTFLKLQEYNQAMDRLKSMQDEMQIFEIVEYRKYAEMLVRNNQEIQKCFDNIKKKDSSWFVSFFGAKQDQNSLKALEESTAMATLSHIKTSVFQLSFKRLEMQLVIRIDNVEDPFMTLIVDSLTYRKCKEKAGLRSQLEIVDVVAKYADYLGYDSRYQYLFQRADIQQDEFQDFLKSMVVVEWESKNDKKTTKVRVEPFRIVLNDETMDKLRIFRDVNGRSSVQPYFAVNRNIVFEEFKKKLNLDSTTQTIFVMTLTIVVPQSLYEPSTEIIFMIESADASIATQTQNEASYSLCMGLDNIHCALKYIDKESVNCGIIKKQHFKRNLLERCSIKCQTTIIALEEIKSLEAKMAVSFSDLKLSANNKQIQQLTYIFKRYAKFFSHTVKSMPLRRRKPSLGQEFLDVVENLTDHVQQLPMKKSKKLENGSNKFIMLTETLVVDISLPLLKMSYLLENEPVNELSLSTVGLYINKKKNKIEAKSFITSISVVFHEYIFFIETIKKIQTKKNQNEQQNKKHIDKLAHDLELNLSVHLNFCLSLYGKNQLFQLSTKLEIQTFDLLQINKEINSKLHFSLKTYDRKKQSVDIVQPFNTSLHIKQNKQIKVNAQQIVMNVTHQLMKNLAELTGCIFGEVKSYKIVNLLNIPVQFKNRGRTIDVNTGKQYAIKLSNHEILQYFISSGKYRELNEEGDNEQVVGNDVRMIKETRYLRQCLVVTFKSNIVFRNESSNIISIIIYKKEPYRDEETFQWDHKSVKTSSMLLKPNSELYLFCQDMHSMEFAVRIEGEMVSESSKIGVGDCIKNNSEQLIASIECFLVIYPQTVSENGKNSFIFHVCCPIQVTNYLPKPISLTFQKDTIEERSCVTEASSFRRPRSQRSLHSRDSINRSWENLALDQVLPLQYLSITSTSVEQINEIYLQFGEYCKAFKLYLNAQILQQRQLFQRYKARKSPSEEYELIKVVTLTNPDSQQLNIVCKMAVRKHSIKLFFMSDLMIFNLLDMDLFVRIKEEGYFYSEVMGRQLITHKVENYQLNDYAYTKRETLQDIFNESGDSIILFTGDANCKNRLLFFNNNEIGFDERCQESNIKIENDGRAAYVNVRRVELELGFSLLFISPTVVVANKSTVSIFVKTSCEKTVRPGEKEPITCFVGQRIKIGVKGISEKYQQFQLDVDVLGIVYFRRQLSKEPGRYRFFRIMTSKSQEITNILIEDSQYPPITFINQLKEKIRISEMSEGRSAIHFHDLNENQSLEYALVNPYKSARFKIDIFNYELTTLHNDIKFRQPAEVFECTDRRARKRIYITTEIFKENRIVLIGYSKEKSEQIQKAFRDRKEQPTHVNFQISQFGLSLFTEAYRQMGYLQYRGIVFDWKSYSRHKVLHFELKDMSFFNYSNSQPRKIINVQRQANLLEAFKSRVGLEIPEKNFIEVHAKFNFDSEVRVIKSLKINILPVLLEIDVCFLLDVLQNMLPMGSLVKKIAQLIGIRMSRKINPVMKAVKSEKSYIVELVKMSSTNIEMTFKNLQILKELYDDSMVHSLLISFLDNMGKLKPFKIQELQLSYETLSAATILKLLKRQNHIHEIVSQIALRPVKQLHDWLMAILGNPNTRSEDGSLISSSLSTTLFVTKTLLKNLLKGKKVEMKELQMNKYNILTKLCTMTSWKQNKQHSQIQPYVTYSQNHHRYERYSFEEVIPYDHDRSLIRYIVKLHENNKSLFRINSIHRINSKNIVAILDNTVVLLDKSASRAQFYKFSQIIGLQQTDGFLKINILLKKKIKSFRDLAIEPRIIPEVACSKQEIQELREAIKKQHLQQAFELP